MCSDKPYSCWFTISCKLSHSASVTCQATELTGPRRETISATKRHIAGFLSINHCIPIQWSMLRLHIRQLPLQGYDKAGSRSAFCQCPETARFTYSNQNSQGLLALRMRTSKCGAGPRQVFCRLLITSSALGTASTVEREKSPKTK